LSTGPAITDDFPPVNEPVVFDASALLCRYLPDKRGPLVDQVLDSSAYPAVTAPARAEVMLGLQLAVDRSRPGRAGQGELWSWLAADWNRFWVLPVSVGGADGVRAAELGARYGLNLANALHLVAMERLPRPAWLLTFDDRQVVAAVDLGFGIVETTLSIPGRSTAHGLLVEPTSRP